MDFSQNYTKELSQHSGTFLLHKNKLSDFQVQARLKPVATSDNRKVARACAVFVRDGPDIVMVDHCGSGGPVRFMATLSREQDYQSTFKMLEGRDGRLLVVHLSSGRSLQVNVETDGISVSLTGIYEDLADLSEGLCSELSLPSSHTKSSVIKVNRQDMIYEAISI